MKKGKVIVFLGPSGVGKATIERKIFADKSLRLKFSISATTRMPRSGEKDGKEYHFITTEKFEKLIKQKAFLEWSNHFNLYYGTLMSEVDKITKSGYNAFLEVETNGAIEIIEKLPKKDLITIFLMPPSIKELEKRIRARNTETEIEIEIRLKKARHEINLAKIFDYIVLNDNIDRAAEEVKKIITERCL